MTIFESLVSLIECNEDYRKKDEPSVLARNIMAEIMDEDYLQVSELLACTLPWFPEYDDDTVWKMWEAGKVFVHWLDKHMFEVDADCWVQIFRDDDNNPTYETDLIDMAAYLNRLTVEKEELSDLPTEEWLEDELEYLRACRKDNTDFDCDAAYKHKIQCVLLAKKYLEEHSEEEAR